MNARIHLTFVFALLAFSAAAEYSRIDVDVSSLPVDKSFLSEILRSRVYERTPPSDAADVFHVKLDIDRSLSGEHAVVRVGG